MSRKIKIRCSIVIRCLRWGGEDFMNWFPVLFFGWCFRVITNRVHLLDGQPGVKIILGFEVALRLNEVYSTGDSVLSRCRRAASRKYETLRTGGGFSGENFQNTGTLIVVRSSVFAKSSAYKTHLARDAHSAYSRWAGRRQVQFFQWLNFRIKTGAKVVTSDDGISVSDVRKEMHCG